MYVEGDIPTVTTTNGSGFGGFGEGWWGIILIALLFGWGRNGIGGFGGNGGGVADGYVLASDFANIERKIDGVNNGLCDGFYAMNTGMLNGFSGVQSTLCQGFSGVNTALVQQGYETRMGVADVNNRLASCCCELKQGLGDLKYIMAQNTCAEIQAGKDNTQRIIDYMAAKDYAALQNENATLKAQMSNNAQSAYIISQLKPCAQPAYIVPNPNCCYGTGCNGSVQ